MADHIIDARPQTGQPRTNKRQCRIQPAHQSLINDVFRSRPLLCTIRPQINFTLASVKNVPVVPAVLDNETGYVCAEIGSNPQSQVFLDRGKPSLVALQVAAI